MYGYDRRPPDDGGSAGTAPASRTVRMTSFWRECQACAVGFQTCGPTCLGWLVSPKRKGCAMVQAVFNGRVIAQSDDTVVVEGNHYFPLESVASGVLSPARTKSLCPWKGVASYFTVEIDGMRCADGAWTYRRPSPFARRIKGRVAFRREISVRVQGQ